VCVVDRHAFSLFSKRYEIVSVFCLMQVELVCVVA
jgi:hypothetical protein